MRVWSLPVLYVCNVLFCSYSTTYLFCIWKRYFVEWKGFMKVIFLNLTCLGKFYLIFLQNLREKVFWFFNFLSFASFVLSPSCLKWLRWEGFSLFWTLVSFIDKYDFNSLHSQRKLRVNIGRRIEKMERVEKGLLLFSRQWFELRLFSHVFSKKKLSSIAVWIELPTISKKTTFSQNTAVLPWKTMPHCSAIEFEDWI